MSTRTQIINAGENFVLPNGAAVISVVYDGEVSLNSTCENLPPPESLACFEFAWEEDDVRGPSASHEIGTQVIGTLQVGNQIRAISVSTAKTDADMKTAMNPLLPGLFTITNYQVTSDTSKKNMNMCFKIPQSLKETTRIEMFNSRINDSGQTVPTFWIYARDPEGDCSCV